MAFRFFLLVALAGAYTPSFSWANAGQAAHNAHQAMSGAVNSGPGREAIERARAEAEARLRQRNEEIRNSQMQGDGSENKYGKGHLAAAGVAGFGIGAVASGQNPMDMVGNILGGGSGSQSSAEGAADAGGDAADGGE